MYADLSSLIQDTYQNLISKENIYFLLNLIPERFITFGCQIINRLLVH